MKPKCTTLKLFSLLLLSLLLQLLYHVQANEIPIEMELLRSVSITPQMLKIVSQESQPTTLHQQHESMHHKECASDKMMQKYIKSDTHPNSKIDLCPKFHICDNANIRNQYLEDKSNKFLELIFIVINDGSDFYSNSERIVAESLAQVNQHYYSVGFSFQGKIQYYRVVDPNTKNEIPNLSIADEECSSNTENENSNCVSFSTLIYAALGENRTIWQKPSTFYVFPVVFQQDTINGFTFLPWMPEFYSTILVHRQTLGSGYTTLSHELAHAFSLYHVFRGISEVSTCNDGCYESEPSDETGDFCSDTLPIAKNWECGLLSIEQLQDGCNANRTTWGSYDFENIMGYSAEQSCRKHFSPQQMARMRCFMDHQMNDSMIPIPLWSNQHPSSISSLLILPNLILWMSIVLLL